jgi:hypothetical protein
LSADILKKKPIITKDIVMNVNSPVVYNERLEFIVDAAKRLEKCLLRSSSN